MANLIVYYSRKGENYWNGSIRNLSKGNTEQVAEFIQEAVGGDLFEVRTVREYNKDYYVCIEEAKQELHAQARPELEKYLESVDKYDTIFVGYPIFSKVNFNLKQKTALKSRFVCIICGKYGETDRWQV